MSDWSEDITLCFLEAYQNEPCIWNSKDINHKNRQKVNDAWTRIGAILNKNVKELKIKKEILMTTFRRHFKKKQDSIRSGAGADDIYKPIWFAYDLMESFLGPVYTSTNNINTEVSKTINIFLRGLFKQIAAYCIKRDIHHQLSLLTNIMNLVICTLM
ncbi:hypothetical protein WA026_018738 [Henosepilachna vigintioctopunctata]|uniref:MADF domain-containing protein n=1 Tax=Henosepilachna vigintioctopunctata TaxID=420089 RepID=A0AAW1TW59_9CUCU